MNLSKLFPIQKELDARIEEEHGLKGQDLLDKKILALQVELGELANEWRGFKFWSNDQEPRDWFPNENDVCEECNGQPIFYGDENNPTKIIGQCDNCDGCGVHFHNPLLEEYVDCLHFILSVGLELGIQEEDLTLIDSFMPYGDDATNQFIDLFGYVNGLRNLGEIEEREPYYNTFSLFLGLGEMLGFATEQIFNAYMDKNKINHARQNEGY